MTGPVVVPLAGSDLSEKALPYAFTLAKAEGTEVLGLGVSSAEEASILTGPKIAHELARAESEYFKRYLTQLQDSFAAKGMQLTTAIVAGDPAEQILNVVSDRQASYLALSTHGRSGLNRWRYGSVASRLVREASVPTLVVGPQVLARDAGSGAINRILVPLDGSLLAEQGLDAAALLAGKLGASLVLARAVSWASQVYPSIDPVTLNQELELGATVYLDNVRERTPAVVEQRVLRGDPSEALIKLVADGGIDLVVMTSHSRAGLARAILGSVADRMLQCDAPVLLIRPVGE